MPLLGLHCRTRSVDTVIPWSWKESAHPTCRSLLKQQNLRVDRSWQSWNTSEHSCELSLPDGDHAHKPARVVGAGPTIAKRDKLNGWYQMVFSRRDTIKGRQFTFDVAWEAIITLSIPQTSIPTRNNYISHKHLQNAFLYSSPCNCHWSGICLSHWSRCRSSAFFAGQ